MAELESMKCPECGAPLHFDNPDQEYCFCSHCGTQVYKKDTHFEDKIELEKLKLKKQELDDKQLKFMDIMIFMTLLLFIIFCIFIA